MTATSNKIDPAKVAEEFKTPPPPSLRRAMLAAGFIDPARYEPTARAAKIVGVPRETLRDATKRGDVEHSKTTSGFVLICVASAQEWAARRSVLTDADLWGDIED